MLLLLLLFCHPSVLTSRRVVRRWLAVSYSGPCCKLDAVRRQPLRTDRERRLRNPRTTTRTWTASSGHWVTVGCGLLAERAVGWSWARSCRLRRRRRRPSQPVGRRRPAGHWSWSDDEWSWRRTRSSHASLTAPSRRPPTTTVSTNEQRFNTSCRLKKQPRQKVAIFPQML